MLKIWGRASAYNVQKVLWFIDELGINYEHIDIGSVIGELESEEFLAMNPHGRIPVIQDNNLYVWESNTIIRYLAATFGKDSYWVADSAERTLVDRWVDWELASSQPDFISFFWAYYRTPEYKRDIVKIEYYKKRCEKNFSILNSQLLINRYVAGSEFSIADIALGTALFRYFNMDIEVVVLPNIYNWYQRLCDRSAFQKNICIPFGDLKGRLEF